MAKREYVSTSVIRRLPRYYRFLGDLIKNGFSRISSKELSQRMGLTASQIRQDLNCFGGFGQQGYGYNVETLHGEIGTILGTDLAHPAILVGAGNIGRAIAMNIGFESMGFRLAGIFDKNPEIIGTQIHGITVRDIDQIDSFCAEYSPEMAVLTVPREAALAVVDQLIKLNVTGFWNFTHQDLAVKYEGIVVENVHLGDSLMTLSYMIKNHPGKKETDKNKQ